MEPGFPKTIQRSSRDLVLAGASPGTTKNFKYFRTKAVLCKCLLIRCFEAYPAYLVHLDMLIISATTRELHKFNDGKRSILESLLAFKVAETKHHAYKQAVRELEQSGCTCDLDCASDDFMALFGFK